MINKYKDHPSITKIKINYMGMSTFAFKPVTNKVVAKIILQLDSSKATGGDIPLKILKEHGIFSHHLCKWINDILSTGIFPDTQKLAIITPIHKMGSPLNKENYRRISILPLLSKIIEKVLYIQISDHRTT